jgi:hypothetical protein
VQRAFNVARDKLYTSQKIYYTDMKSESDVVVSYGMMSNVTFDAIWRLGPVWH